MVPLSGITWDHPRGRAPLVATAEEFARDHGVPIRPGARELLAEVAAAGLPHALVTSSEREFMDAVLARTGLSFDALVCADDVSVTKPDPEPYLLAAKLLGADPARCVALEDSPNGVASAEAAGCRVIAVPSLVPIEPAPGRTVVRSLLARTTASAIANWTRGSSSRLRAWSSTCAVRRVSPSSARATPLRARSSGSNESSFRDAARRSRRSRQRRGRRHASKATNARAPNAIGTMKTKSSDIRPTSIEPSSA